MKARAFIIAFLMLLSYSSFAQNEKQNDVVWVKDWRLEKPFLHGFIGAITLNQFKLFPESWKQAEKNEPNAMGPGAVNILERNKKIPFGMGIFFGLAFILIICLALFQSYKYRFVIKYFKKQMAEYDAK
ncbi:MAG: hypothetical protein ACI92O_000524 [Colwellia sp.]|jgi:hypothetical protein